MKIGRKLNWLTVLFVAMLLLDCTVLMAKKNEKKPEKNVEKIPDCSAALFPAEGKLKLEHGTVECWCALDYSFDKNNLNNLSMITPMTFFSFGKEKEDSQENEDIRDISLMLVTQQGKAMVNVVRYRTSLALMPVKDKKVPGGVSFPMEDFKWKKGEWHFLAATWKKEGDSYDLTFYIDDKEESKSGPANEFKPDSLSEYQIRIGSVLFALGAVETLRVSNKVRTADEIKESFKTGLKEDKDTSFFFDPKTIGKMQKKGKTKDISKIKVSPKGTFVGPYKIIKGKFDKAVQFHE